MDDQKNQNEAADGRSDSTAVLATTCAIGGVFSVNGRLAACGQHTCGNGCAYAGECEHKVVANHE